MSCGQCKELKAQLDKEPDCDACLMPKLLPANYVVLYIFRRYGIMISNGNGGLILSEIILVCELEDILPTLHLINKLTLYYQEMIRTEDG